MGQHDMTLTDVDRCRLGTLLTSAEMAAFGGARSRFDLETKLEEAEAIPVACTPRTLVTMNSTVMLVDIRSGEHKICTLVYPEDRDLIPHSVGVLQSGQCILGRSVGDIVEMTDGVSSRRFRIDSVVYQPEAAGAHHL